MRFIDDLIPLILECNDHWWPRDLQRLSQVSLAWVGPTRRRLYASPHLYTFRACSQFARTLSENISLASLVKGYDLRPTPENEPDNGQADIRDWASVRFILALEGIQHITLGGYLSIGAERFLNTLGDPFTIHDLHIDGSSMVHSLVSRPSLEWDEAIAFKFSNLRKIHLTSIELDITYPSIPYQLSVIDLILENVTITNGFIIHLLHETPSLQRLCVLSKSSSELGEHIRVVLAAIPVQVLEYEVQMDPPSHESIFEHGSPIHSLRCLHFNGIHADFETLRSISQSCPNLEELSISGRTVNIHCEEWISFIDSGALPSLRRLGVPWGTHHPPFLRWSGAAGDALIAAGATRKIQVSPNPSLCN